MHCYIVLSMIKLIFVIVMVLQQLPVNKNHINQVNQKNHSTDNCPLLKKLYN